MIDRGDVQRPQEGIKQNPESRLTAEQWRRTDQDIRTLASLRRYAKGNGFTFALTGGYAVDAIEGGVITRPHADMDGIFFLPPHADYMYVTEDIEEILRREQTRWQSHPTMSDMLEFRETGDEKPWEQRRRMEIDLFDTSMDYGVTSTFLVDSRGNSHEFDTLSLASLLAGKVFSTNRLSAMTGEQREQQNVREMRESDKRDFQRLLNHPDFNKGEVIEQIASLNKKVSDENLSDEDARASAVEQWEKAARLLT
jgi:hypothetical protein